MPLSSLSLSIAARDTVIALARIVINSCVIGLIILRGVVPSERKIGTPACSSGPCVVSCPIFSPLSELKANASTPEQIYRKSYGSFAVTRGAPQSGKGPTGTFITCVEDTPSTSTSCTPLLICHHPRFVIESSDTSSMLPLRLVFCRDFRHTPISQTIGQETPIQASDGVEEPRC
jgi:hypothetical protein